MLFHGIFRKLDLSRAPLYIGGVPSLDKIFDNPGHVSSYDFVGCMRDIYLNDIALDVGMAIARYGVTNSCPRVSECDQTSCHEGSMCVDKWFDTLCKCTNDDFSGWKCSESKCRAKVLGSQ